MGRLTAEISFQRSDSDSETSCTGYAFLPSAGYRVLVFTTAVDCVNDLFAARLQMAISLGFHIIFAEIGIAMPLMMVIAEWRWRRTGDAAFLQLAKRWANGTAGLFAGGAGGRGAVFFAARPLWPSVLRRARPPVRHPVSPRGGLLFLLASIFVASLYADG